MPALFDNLLQATDSAACEDRARSSVPEKQDSFRASNSRPLGCISGDATLFGTLRLWVKYRAGAALLEKTHGKQYARKYLVSLPTEKGRNNSSVTSWHSIGGHPPPGHHRKSNRIFVHASPA